MSPTAAAAPTPDSRNGWDWSYLHRPRQRTPPTPAWAATYVNQSYPSSMTAGTTAVVWAEFRNDGKPATGSTPRPAWAPHSPPGPLEPGSEHARQLGRLQSPDRRRSVRRRPGPGGALQLHPHRAGHPRLLYRKVQARPRRHHLVRTRDHLDHHRHRQQGHAQRSRHQRRGGAASAGRPSRWAASARTTTNSSRRLQLRQRPPPEPTRFRWPPPASNAASAGVTINAGPPPPPGISPSPRPTPRPPRLPCCKPPPPPGPPASNSPGRPRPTTSVVTGYQVRRNGTVIALAQPAPAITDNTRLAAGHLHLRRASPRRRPQLVRLEQRDSGHHSRPTRRSPRCLQRRLQRRRRRLDHRRGRLRLQHCRHPRTYAGSGAAFLCRRRQQPDVPPVRPPVSPRARPGAGSTMKRGWKVGICGWAYRHALSLRNGDEAPPVCSSTTSSTVLPTTASTSTDRRDQWRFAHRLRHRDANTDCNGDVGLLETHRQQRRPAGRPRDHRAQGHRSVRYVHHRSCHDQRFLQLRIGRLPWGSGSLPPVPVIGMTSRSRPPPRRARHERAKRLVAHRQSAGISAGPTTPLRLRRGRRLTGEIVAPQYPAAGWDPPRCHLLAAGRPDPHTQYARKVRAGTARSTAPLLQHGPASTLSPAPPAAAASFPMFQRLRRCHHHLDRRRRVRPGKVQYYKYAWDNLPTHAFDGSEPIWSAGTIATAGMPPAPGTSTCRASTPTTCPNGTFDYPVAVAPPPPRSPPLPRMRRPASALLPTSASARFGGNLHIPLAKGRRRHQKRAASQRHDRPDAAHRRRRPRARRRLQVGRHRNLRHRRIARGRSTLKDATAIVTQPPRPAHLLRHAGEPLRPGVGSALTYHGKRMEWMSRARNPPQRWRSRPWERARPAAISASVTGECGSATSDPAHADSRITGVADFDSDSATWDEVDYDHYHECALGPGVMPG